MVDEINLGLNQAINDAYFSINREKGVAFLTSGSSYKIQYSKETTDLYVWRRGSSSTQGSEWQMCGNVTWDPFDTSCSFYVWNWRDDNNPI